MFISSSSYAQSCVGNASVVGRAGKNIELTTYEDLVNGKTAVMYPEAGFKLKNTAFCPHWRLTARVHKPFTSHATNVNYLDPQHVSIQFNSVVDGPPGAATGIPTNPFPLLYSETTIIPSFSQPLDGAGDRKFDIVYDMIIQGGNHLLVLDNGTYQSQLEFTLYNEAGQSVSTSSFPISFEINYGASNSSTLELRNGADNITLAFNSGNDITNGITVTRALGMVVHSKASHQIMVKAASSHLLGAGTNNTLPVSAITLSVAAVGNVPRIICFTRPLSVTSTVFVDNPMTTNDYRDVTYDLTYSIAGNDPNIINAQIGTYSTSIVFSIVPK